MQRMLPPEQLAGMRTFLQRIGTVVPGIIVISWMVMIAANGALAQGLLKRIGRNQRPGPDIAGIELPEWILVAAAAAALFGYFLPDPLGFFGKNALAILLLPFVVLGLAVIHTVARHFKAGIFMLAIVYILLILFSPLVVTLALLGVLDQLLGLRRRIAAPPST